jgi:DNA primase
MSGAQAAYLADLSPLRGRRVLIWPDADAPGANYARTIAELAIKAGAASVEVLDLASISEASHALTLAE